MTELPVEQVRTLLAVVDEGTFDAAAAVLHVTPSAVSQRVKALEQRTGRVLLQRTKPVRPTESGAVLVRFARQLARLERDAWGELGLNGTGEPTRVSVAVNADSLATWFLPALTRVADLCFELRREDEDHTAALLREGLVMAAVTSAPDPVPGCTVRPLGRMRYLPVASPEFLTGRPAGRPPAQALDRAPVVVFDRKDDFQDGFARRLGHGSAGPFRPQVPSEGFLEAVAAGLGWGMVPEAQAVPLLERGRLAVLVPGAYTDVALYWQQWKLDSPALAALAEAVTATAAEALRR
jgi:LysR family transcriptional regulator (chromosome initiation inhibitor)